MQDPDDRDGPWKRLDEGDPAIVRGSATEDPPRRSLGRPVTDPATTQPAEGRGFGTIAFDAATRPDPRSADRGVACR